MELWLAGCRQQQLAQFFPTLWLLPLRLATEGSRTTSYIHVERAIIESYEDRKKVAERLKKKTCERASENFFSQTLVEGPLVGVQSVEDREEEDRDHIISEEICAGSFFASKDLAKHFGGSFPFSRYTSILSY